MTGEPRSPALARALLGLLIPSRYRDNQLGDLEEEFRAQGRRDGWKAARRWYWRQMITSLPRSSGSGIARNETQNMDGGCGDEAVVPGSQVLGARAAEESSAHDHRDADARPRDRCEHGHFLADEPDPVHLPADGGSRRGLLGAACEPGDSVGHHPLVAAQFPGLPRPVAHVRVTRRSGPGRDDPDRSGPASTDHCGQGDRRPDGCLAGPADPRARLRGWRGPAGWAEGRDDHALDVGEPIWR